MLDSRKLFGKHKALKDCGTRWRNCDFYKMVCDSRDQSLFPVYAMQALYLRTTPSAKNATLKLDLVFQSSCFLEITGMI